jgi:MoxR-like ATPase
MFKLNVPFLNRAELNEVVHRTTLTRSVEVSRVMDGRRILELRQILEKVVVAEPLRDYAVRLVLATHPAAAEAGDAVRRYVKWGASPRAVQALIRAARVRALAEGRAHVAFDDIRHFAPEVLGHRVLLNYDGLAETISVADLVDELARVVQEEAAA